MTETAPLQPGDGAFDEEGLQNLRKVLKPQELPDVSFRSG